jgi:hypothetical protein
MDKLEEHIRKNREVLDEYDPSPEVWKKINKKSRRDSSHFIKWVSVAAIIIVIMGTSLYFLKRQYFGSDKGIAHSNQDTEKDNFQLKESEIYYNNLLKALYHEATPLLTANPEIRIELDTDISHLDSICVDIRKDLKDNVANQEVIEALIQNYRLKIQLLEDMLTVLKEPETKPEKKKSYEL